MAAKARNMVDLDSTHQADRGGRHRKQLLITRGALTTFSIMNDSPSTSPIIPAMFMITYPPLQLNIMNSGTPPEKRFLARRGDLQCVDHRGLVAARVAARVK